MLSAPTQGWPGIFKGELWDNGSGGTSDELAELPGLTPESLRKLRLAHGQIGDFFDLIRQYQPKQVFAVALPYDR